jgi:hypothetical protein
VRWSDPAVRWGDREERGDSASAPWILAQGTAAHENKCSVPKPGVHILRHTFCSHLAMKGAPAKAIQELAGHVDLSTTQQYMHLTPSAKREAIRLLDLPNPGRHPGDGLEKRGIRKFPKKNGGGGGSRTLSTRFL